MEGIYSGEGDVTRESEETRRRQLPSAATGLEVVVVVFAAFDAAEAADTLPGPSILRAVVVKLHDLLRHNVRACARFLLTRPLGFAQAVCRPRHPWRIATTRRSRGLGPTATTTGSVLRSPPSSPCRQ